MPQILRMPEVRAETSLSKASVYRHMDAGTFPPKISLGPRSTGWYAHEITAWIAAKATGKDDEFMRTFSQWLVALRPYVPSTPADKLNEKISQEIANAA